MKRFVACVVLLALACTARAGTFDVQVGYADALRPNSFFPGGAGVTFIGSTSAGYDAGAIRIVDTSGTVTITSVSVTNLGLGANSFSLWGASLPVTLNNVGDSLILTQTGDYNFDTSDYGGTPGSPSTNVPHVIINGTQYDDTGHVLDTLGYDVAVYGYPTSAPGDLNESAQWRLIGTNGGQAGTPEPATITLLGIGIAGMAGYGWRRKKQLAKV